MREKKYHSHNRFDKKPFFKSGRRSSDFVKPKPGAQNFSRFKLYIEYEGTRYSGWQKQENAKTIQGSLIKAAIDVS